MKSLKSLIFGTALVAGLAGCGKEESNRRALSYDGFGPAILTSTPSGGESEGRPRLYDFDGDGDLDMVTPELGDVKGNPATGGLFYFQGDKNNPSYFGEAVKIAENSPNARDYQHGYDSVELGDINGDGILDLIAGTEENFVAYLITQRGNDKSVPFSKPVKLHVNSTEADFCTISPSKDLFVSGEPTYKGRDDIKIFRIPYKPSGERFFGEPYQIGTLPNSEDCSLVISPGDLNKDGIDDVITFGHGRKKHTEYEVALFLSQREEGQKNVGYKSFELGKMDFALNSPMATKIGDLNNDGLEEIVIASQNDVALLRSNPRNNPSMEFSWIQKDNPDMKNVEGIDASYISRKDRKDLVLIDAGEKTENSVPEGEEFDGHETIWIMKALREQEFSKPEKIHVEGGLKRESPSIVAQDLNGDGKLDVILGRAESYPLPYRVHFGK